MILERRMIERRRRRVREDLAWLSPPDPSTNQHIAYCYETSIFISFLDYWQVTLIWSPDGDASLIRLLLIGDTSTIYYTDVAIRVTMTLY